MNQARPTLKDVAERSGYALRTVKKVMGGDPNVRDATKEAVLRAADELNYTPNRIASALAKKQNIKIALVYSSITEAYFPEIKEGFEKCLEEYRDFGFSVEYHLTSKKGWEAQKPLLEALIEREDISGVVVQPVSGTMLKDSIDKLSLGGKPVITFGADAPGSRRLCYVGPNTYKSGRIGGQILANYIGKKGKVFIINQVSDHMQTQERSRGFLDRIQEHYPEIQAYSMNLPDNSTLYYEMVHGIVENEQVAALFCTDANTYLAGRVLQDMGITDVVLVGFDLSEEGIQLMREGYIKVIIEQKPDVIAYKALKSMYEYLSMNITPPEIVNTELYIMTSECF